jgi:hypothetical protein
MYIFYEILTGGVSLLFTDMSNCTQKTVMDVHKVEAEVEGR